MSVKYIVYRQFMATSTILKNTVSIEEWMAATKETKKHCTLACHFSVYKLIGWEPVNLYLFKVPAETLEKGVEFV